MRLGLYICKQQTLFIMSVKYKLSASIIKNANNRLIEKGISKDIQSSFQGVIRINTSLKSIEVTREQINKAYKDSIEKYAEKL